MLTFQQRRDTILSQFAQAKADLETLNSDIDAEIEKNKSVISNQLLPVWLDRLSGNYHASPFFFSLQVESSTLHTLHDGRYYKESFCSCKMPLL